MQYDRYKSMMKEPETGVLEGATARAQVLTVLISVGVTVCDTFLKKSFTLLMRWAALPTKSQQEASMLWKLSLAYLFNNFIVPIATNYVTVRNYDNCPYNR